MECFNETVEVITKALNNSLREKNKKGEFVINIQRTKGQFNIWIYKMELLWIVCPGVYVSVHTLQNSFPVPNGKEREVRDTLLVIFVQQLFENQADIWNLINTSQH